MLLRGNIPQANHARLIDYLNPNYPLSADDKPHGQFVPPKNPKIGPMRLLRIKETLVHMLLDGTIPQVEHARLMELLDPDRPLDAEETNQQKDVGSTLANYEGHPEVSTQQGSIALPVEGSKDTETRAAAEGCLFAACIRCSSTIRVKYHTDRIPSFPPSAEYKNGIVMTICQACDHGPSRSFENELGIDARLMKGSIVARAAESIAGVSVAFVSADGRLQLVERKTILESTASADSIVSVNFTDLDVVDGAALVESHLWGGFF